MKRVHIIGRKNHGKTQLVVDLVEELGKRGLSIGTIKHTHHKHELDTPGKDSHRHRTAGAKAVGILSQSMSAVFVPADAENVDRYQLLAPMFRMCDLVIVEGDSQTAAPKIEVWRAELQTDPLSVSDPSIRAVVTDDELAINSQVHARSNVAALVDWIITEWLS